MSEIAWVALGLVSGALAAWPWAYGAGRKRADRAHVATKSARPLWTTPLDCPRADCFLIWHTRGHPHLATYPKETDRG